MGTKLGPSYACLFMGYIEEQMMNNYTGIKPTLFLRYIDDIIGLADMTLDNLTEFISFANSFHPAIKLSHTIGKSVDFLDCTFRLDVDRIVSTIFYKDTDAHSYLDYESSHPIKCKNSIPYSQFVRLRKICSDSEDFSSKSEEMSKFFLERGYPQNVIKTSLEKAKQTDRNELLGGTKRNESLSKTRIPLVLTFHPTNIPVKNIIYNNFHILKNNGEFNSLFEDVPLLAFRKDKSLKDVLVRSTVKSNVNSDTVGTFPCKRNKCVTCRHVVQKSVITGPSSSFTIKSKFTCITEGVIYCIICKKCGDLYIGETGRKMADRFREHKYAVKKHGTTTEVARHFNKKDHSIDDMSVCILLKSQNTALRKKTEENLIKRLGSLDPCGMNELCNLTSQ